jgi:hypothetical protein
LRAFFQLALVLQAIWRPRHRFEALWLNRSAIDETLAVRAILDPLEGGSYLCEDVCIAVSQREILVLELIDAREVTSRGLIVVFIASRFTFVPYPRGKLPLEFQQPVSVVLNVHGSASFA